MKTKKFFQVFMISIILFFGCTEKEFIETTSEDVLIGEYLELNADQYSSFYEILVKTGTIAFLKTYGTYTCFAPTNEAVSNYITAKGKGSLNDFTIEELKILVRYHIIIDTISSTYFTDGKIATPTMYGQYLTAQTVFEEGETKIKINKYAEIDKKDIKTANGIIHSVKSVLEPVFLSIAELIEQDPELSIFAEALRETGLYDTLNVIPVITGAEDEIVRWFTVFVHTDAILANDGINSYEDLKSKYCNTGNPKDPKDSLYLYIAYHCLDNSLKYIGDLVTEPSHLTMAPQEVITIRLKADSVLINEEEFNNVLEKGVLVDRANSDNTAANGVYHLVGQNYAIKMRLPLPVYWDVADQPELRKMPAVFRKPGNNLFIELGQLADVTWSYNTPIEYIADAGWQGDYLVYHDFLNINLRTAVIQWIEFTTPLIIKGKYKLWVCTRNVYDPNRRPKFLVYFDDEVLPNIVATDNTLPKLSDEELELQGFKRYNYNPNDSLYLTDANGRFAARLAGTVEVPTTGRHKVKFVTINNGDKYLWLDMIQFIPYESNQLWPRLDKDGILYDKPSWYPMQ